jgi:hypothetical protein
MAGKPKPMNDDLFERVRRAMVEATRLIFTDYRKDHAGETFYAFALYADNYAQGMNPASQTEEAYQRRLAKNTMYGPGELGLLRYCPDEWDMDYCGTHRDEEWSKVTDLLDPILEDDNLTWEQAARPAFETMIQALAELDQEGFFGRGADREAVTLMIWITDSSLAEEWWAKSVKQLNPAKVYERFITSGIPENYKV